VIEMSSISILLIDDDSRRGNQVRDDIRTATTRGTEWIRPPPLEEADSILDNGIEMVVVDYELRMADENGVARNYMGGALLSKLREAERSVPMVLLTSPSIFNQYPQVLKAAEIADVLLFKKQLHRDSVMYGRRLNSLISGYQKLRTVPQDERSWEKLLELLGAKESVYDLLVIADPPVGPDDSIRPEIIDLPNELIEEESKKTRSDRPEDEGELEDEDVLVSMKRGWTEHDVSKWVISTLFKYPGILYANAFAAASLGIDPDSFAHSEKILDLFSDAKYCGVFSDYDDYYWSGNLRRIAVKLIGLSDPSRRISETVVPWLIDKEYDVKPAVCIVDEKPYADTICYICKAPVKTRNSLVYFPDNRPSVMERSRVSFKAIRRSNRPKKKLFRGSDRKTFEQIRRGNLQIEP